MLRYIILGGRAHGYIDCPCAAAKVAAEGGENSFDAKGRGRRNQSVSFEAAREAFWSMHCKDGFGKNSEKCYLCALFEGLYVGICVQKD